VGIIIFRDGGMTSRHESSASRKARQMMREPPPFYGTILDLGMADKTQVELFGAIGSTRGPFQGVIDGPYLNGLIEDNSRTLLTTEGEEAWQAAGGTYGEDGKPTFVPRSSHAAQVVRGGGAGRLHLDRRQRHRLGGAAGFARPPVVVCGVGHQLERRRPRDRPRGP
jgi:hypothetical protein